MTGVKLRSVDKLISDFIEHTLNRFYFFPLFHLTRKKTYIHPFDGFDDDLCF